MANEVMTQMLNEILDDPWLEAAWSRAVAGAVRDVCQRKGVTSQMEIDRYHDSAQVAFPYSYFRAYLNTGAAEARASMERVLMDRIGR